MSLYRYRGVAPNIADGVFIAPSADIIGRVTISSHASVWHQVVVRGDVNDITIGANTNIQDLSMLHVVEDIPLVIGAGVSVGHNAILHACTIEDHCLIGMGAIVLDGAVIKKNSVVAAGSVVPPGKTYPEGSMIMGSPAKAVRALTEEEKSQYGNHFESYIHTKNEYLDNSLVELIN